MKLKETDQLKLLTIILIALALVGHVLLSIFVFPKLKATNHPVQITMGANEATEVYLSYADDEPPLRLVPLEKKSYVWTWGTELPARTEYDLKLQFVKDYTSVQFLSIYVIDLSPEVKSIKIPTDGLMLNERAAADVQLLKNDIFLIIGNEGGSVSLADDFSPTSKPVFSNYILFTVTYVFLASLVISLILFGLKFPYHVNEIYWVPLDRVNQILLLILVIFGGALHLGLVFFSMPDFWPADSTSYTMKAVSLADAGTFDSGTQEYELNRMPGYPFFMALIFKIFGWDLQWVSRWQAILFVASMVSLVWSVRNWGRGWLIGLGAFVALVSPPVVWASRQIATESLFMSAWLFAIAFWFIAWRSDGVKRWICVLIFTAFTVAAVSIRPNGVLLLAFPGCLLVGALWCWATKGRSKIDYDWTPPIVIFEVIIPFAAVAAFLALWSWRNYESRGFARPTDITQIVYANAPFYTGTFDIRSAEDDKMYDWFVINRRKAGYAFHGWAVRNYEFLDVTDQYKNITNSVIGELYDEMKKFNTRHAALVPLDIGLAGRIRAANWGLWLPKGHANSLDAFQQNYSVKTKFDSEALENKVRNNLRWATRQTSEYITIEESVPFEFMDEYNGSFVKHYSVIYGFVIVMGVLLFTVTVYFGMVHRAALMMPFFLNILLNIYFQYIVGRYVQVLDFSLFLGIVLCLGPILLPRLTDIRD